MRLAVTVLASLVLPGAVWAACTSPAAPNRAMVYNNTSKTLQVCKGTVWEALFTTSAGVANCSTPAGKPGQLIYNSTYKVLQLCNGTGWANLGNTNQGGGSGPCTSPAGKEGTIIYNTTADAPQYCNGDAWVNAGRWISPHAFIPTDLADIQLWVKADTLAQADGSAVTALADSSGKGHNLTTYGGGGFTTPSFKTGALSGLPALNYDNDTDVLQYPGNFTVGSVVGVMKNNGTTFSTYNGIVGGADTNPGNGHILNAIGAGGTTLGTAVTNSWTCYQNGTSAGACALSNIDQSFILAATAPAPISTNNDIWIGAISDHNRAWNGEIMELVITSTALTQQQREKLEGYLAHKYGLSASLPVNHPYKNSAP